MSRETPSVSTFDRPARVAVVGAGFISDCHLEILTSTPGLEVVAVVDLDETRARTAAARWEVPCALGNLEDLPRARPDIAHVVVPPEHHAPIATALLDLGIGVFIEKPLALNRDTAAALCKLALDRGLPLGVNHNNLYHPAVRRLLERVQSGELGAVQHVRVCWNLPLRQLETRDHRHWMFRSPRNILFEQGPHPFSLVNALLGPAETLSASALGTRDLEPGLRFHDRWLIGGTARDGTAEIYLAFGQGLPRNTIEVLCTDGAVEADLTHNLLQVETKAPFLEFWNSFLAGRRRSRALGRGARQNLLRYLANTLGLGPREDPFFVSMRESIRRYHSAVRRNRTPPVDGKQGTEVVGWCEAVAASIPSEQEAPAQVHRQRDHRSGDIVVLGGTGFIGRRVVDLLLAERAPVTVVARRADGLCHGLPAAQSADLRLLRGALESPETLRTALAGSHSVIHLATGSSRTWQETQESMVHGSVALARICLELGVKRLIFVSSIAALYLGHDRGDAKIEDDWETDPCPERRDFYARGKIATEAELRRLHRESALPVVVVRPGVVLGRGASIQHSGLGYWVRDNHCIGWGKGQHPLPLVWVDDVAAILAELATHTDTPVNGQAVNLCTRVPLSASETVAEMARASGRSLHFHPRSLWLSQLMEMGKFAVKRIGGRPGTRLPSYRDLKSRALFGTFTSRTAREQLGWTPLEEREAFLERAIRGQVTDGPSQRKPPT